MGVRTIGILLFDEVELLDFAGPMQMFAAHQGLFPEDIDRLTTIGLTDKISVSKVGMTLNPDVTIDSWGAELDLLIIPGGMGTRPIIKNQASLISIDDLLSRTKIVATVCTGSLILAQLGRLKDKKATTHFMALDKLKSIDASIDIDRSRRYHDHGDVIISEGVSAGIDMSLHLIARFYGDDKADKVRKYVEYYPLPYTK